MTKSPFRRIRALDDKTLVGALSNHQVVISNIIAWVARHDRWQWAWRFWALGLSSVVFWFAWGDDVQRLFDRWFR